MGCPKHSFPFSPHAHSLLKWMNKLTVIWTPISSPLLPSLPLTHHHQHHLLCCLALSLLPLPLPPPSSMASQNGMTQADRWIPMEQRVSNGWAKRLFCSSQPMARDSISGQSVCQACFLYLSTVLPAGDTPELLCPPEDSVRQVDLCAQPWPSHQPPPYYGVSAYWQYYLQLRFTATLSMVSIFLSIYLSASHSLYLTLSLSGPLTSRPSLSLSGGGPYLLTWGIFAVSCIMARESQRR